MIDRMGGLARRLPWTATAFLLGSVAIVGLPPLNGFVSEWVVFSAILQTGAANDALRIAIIGAPGLALIGGLALACFTKIDGIMFLGHPRTNLPEPARDPSWNTLLPLLGLAAGCLLIGLLPVIALRPGMEVASLLIEGVVPSNLLQSTGALAGRLSALMLILILTTVLVFVFRERTLRRSAAFISDTWACGFPPPSRAQYTASSYAAMLLTAFRPMSGVHESRTRTGYFSHPFDLMLDGMVLPVWRRLGGINRRMKGIQGGRIRWYLLSVVLTLVFLLLRVALRQETP
jgi:NADH:ubiquinone oxidoreductase subunit 5 (subunit L)/multisubunit Na+/H+ antiporter MnhA subunit